LNYNDATFHSNNFSFTKFVCRMSGGSFRDCTPAGTCKLERCKDYYLFLKANYATGKDYVKKE